MSVRRAKRNPGKTETCSDAADERPALLSAVMCLQLRIVSMSKEEDNDVDQQATPFRQLKSYSDNHQISRYTSVFCGWVKECGRTSEEEGILRLVFEIFLPFKPLVIL